VWFSIAWAREEESKQRVFVPGVSGGFRVEMLVIAMAWVAMAGSSSGAVVGLGIFLMFP